MEIVEVLLWLAGGSSVLIDLPTYLLFRSIGKKRIQEINDWEQKYAGAIEAHQCLSTEVQFFGRIWVRRSCRPRRF